MFLAKHSPFNWLLRQQWMTYTSNFLFQKMTYIMVLKVTTFHEAQLNRFGDI